MQWFIENRPDFSAHVETQSYDGGVRRFLSLVNRTRLRSVLHYMLDEEEFLSPYGIRALSRYHKDHPYVFSAMGMDYRVDYEPAESSTGLFGGQFELAWPDLVSGELSADRIAAEVSLLPRRRVQGRIPDEIRSVRSVE